MNNKIVGIFIISLFVLSSVSAITGSIGNARMILRVEKGDLIERTVLVRNVNDVSLDVSLFASGDLIDDMDILDNEFRLGPGEEKRARFEIKIREEGTTENKVNVQFSPQDGTNGIGLTSTIIVIAKGEGELDFDDEDDVIDDDSSGLDLITGDVVGSGKGNTLTLFFGGVVLLLVLLLVLLVMLVSKKKKMMQIKSKKRAKKSA